MQLENMLIPARVATGSWSIREVFDECARHCLPGLAFQDESGKVIGKVSLRDVLKNTCLPDYIVANVHLVGDHLANISIPEIKALHILELPARDFVLNDFARIDSAAPVIKAVATMEHYQTAYIFVIDDGLYRGVVTLVSIVKRMLELHP